MAADGNERGIAEINMQHKQTEWFWDNQLNYDAANLRNYYMTAYLHNEPRRTNVIISDYFNLFVKTWWKSRHVSLSKEDSFFFFYSAHLNCYVSSVWQEERWVRTSVSFSLLFKVASFCRRLLMALFAVLSNFFGEVISHCVSCRLDWLKEVKGFIELILQWWHNYSLGFIQMKGWATTILPEGKKKKDNLMLLMRF